MKLFLLLFFLLGETVPGQRHSFQLEGEKIVKKFLENNNKLKLFYKDDGLNLVSYFSEENHIEGFIEITGENAKVIKDFLGGNRGGLVPLKGYAAKDHGYSIMLMDSASGIGWIFQYNIRFGEVFKIYPVSRIEKKIMLSAVFSMRKYVKKAGVYQIVELGWSAEGWLKGNSHKIIHSLCDQN